MGSGFGRWLGLFAVLLGLPDGVSAQNKTSIAPRPTVTGIYPVDLKTAGEPLNQQARFEIRRCGSYDVQLLGFKAKSTAPSMVVADDFQIGGIIQHGSWIVIQLVAGDGNPTLEAQFRKGIPSLLSRVDGDDGILYKEDGEYATISIPLKEFPGFREGKCKIFHLKSHDD
jgi:hypothetical protein